MFLKNRPKEFDLYSFDIFDTLITRTTANPVGIFSIMQYKLQHETRFQNIPYFVKENFSDIRLGADYFSRQVKNPFFSSSKVQDVTLIDIYNVLKNNYNLSDDLINSLIEFELETEEKNLYPIRKNIDKVKALYNEGKKVILISDMYLPASFLKKILVSFDEVFENIELFVSNEYNSLKYSGDLYKLIKDKYNVEYKNWYHFGDNAHSDFKVPKKLGIDAEKYDYSSLTSWEDDYFSHTNFDIKGQVCFGIAKLCKEMSNNKTVPYNFAVSFGAPVLYSYVNWVLDTALKEEIKDLYFMARDGYVLQKIADIIIEKKNLPIKTHYFYGSRLSIRVPNEENFEKYINAMLNEFSYIRNLKFISERLNLDVDFILKYATKFDSSSVNNLLSNDDVKYLIDVFNTNETLKNVIIQKGKEKENLLKRYVNQEIDFKNKFAFVDIAGTGKTQDLLYSVMGENKPNIFDMFYLSTNILDSSNCLGSRKRACISTGIQCPYIFEFVCRCPQGQTLGYEEHEGKIIPINEFEQFDAILNCGFDDYMIGIKDYVERILEFEEKNNFHLSFANIIRYWHRLLVTYSNIDLATIISKIPYSAIGKESDNDIYLKEYSLFETLFLNPESIELFWFIRLAISSELVKKIFDYKCSKLTLFQYIKERLQKRYFRL